VILHSNNLAVTGNLRKLRTNKRGGVNAKMPIGINFRAIRTFIFGYTNYRERIYFYTIFVCIIIVQWTTLNLLRS